MIIGVRHTGIVVHDIEGALNFWTNLLGAKILVDQIEKGEFISLLLGIENVSVRTVKLDAGDGTVVELLSFRSHQDESMWTGKPYSTGITHVALNVSDIEKLTLNLEMAGYFQLNPFNVDPSGKVKVAYLRGYEGLLLELVQTL
jgi:catechol 2,3-dioxygenase-like lactoylglutathione lyase family enzyme